MYVASSCRKTISGEAWLAVGDSASSYDPLSGRGIFKAMRQGTNAAIAVDGFLRGERRSPGGLCRARPRGIRCVRAPAPRTLRRGDALDRGASSGTSAASRTPRPSMDECARPRRRLPRDEGFTRASALTSSSPACSRLPCDWRSHHRSVRRVTADSRRQGSTVIVMIRLGVVGLILASGSWAQEIRPVQVANRAERGYRYPAFRRRFRPSVPRTAERSDSSDAERRAVDRPLPGYPRQDTRRRRTRAARPRVSTGIRRQAAILCGLHRPERRHRDRAVSRVAEPGRGGCDKRSRAAEDRAAFRQSQRRTGAVRP